MTATTCHRCGEPVSPGKRFCAGCGADVSGAQTAVVTRTTPEGNVPPESSLLDLLRQATAGEYEVLAEIGRGGMASVFLAHDIPLDRKVAIKVMAPALMTGEGMAERFKREARTAASLSHPNIIPIYAVKESAHLLFFVMKFIEGRSLDSVIQDIGPLPLPLVQTILHQVGDALGYAHRRGIIHRDIKPANIMVDADGHTVVTDFGIAKVLEAKGLTMSGVAVGTPAYMSPEQCGTKEITGSSDQYSLGVVTYEMLAGRPPFDDGTFMTLMYAHCNTPPSPIAPTRPDLPASIAAAVMRMLEKDPGNRFATVQDAVKALGGTPLGLDDPRREELMLLAKKGTAAELRQRLRTPTSPVPPSRPSMRGKEPAQPGTSAPRPATGSRRWLLPVAGVALAAIVALLATRPWSRATPDTAATAPPANTDVPPQSPSAPTPATRVLPVPAPAGATGDGPRVAVEPLADHVAQKTIIIPEGANADSAFRAMVATARALRDSATAAGARPGQLGAGDIAMATAEGLAAAGQTSFALIQLGRASQAWEQAIRGGRINITVPPPDAPGFPRRSAPPAVRAGLDSLLIHYSRALASGDTVELRRVYPTMPPRFMALMRRTVQRGRDVQVNLRLTEAHPEGDGVRGVVSGMVTSSVGGAPVRSPIVQRMLFTRTPDGWSIAHVEMGPERR